MSTPTLLLWLAMAILFIACNKIPTLLLKPVMALDFPSHLISVIFRRSWIASGAWLKISPCWQKIRWMVM